MNTITITYNGVLPTVTWERETASGQVKTLRAVFVFSPDWEAYPIRTAVFEGCGIKVKRKLDASNACDVPADVVKHAGRLSVGAFANKVEGDPWPRYCGRPAVENIPQGVCPARACDAEDDGSEYEQFLAELNGKVDRYQGEKNAGCSMIVDEDGFLRPGQAGNTDEEQIAALVNAYLEKHPSSIPPTSDDVLGGGGGWLSSVKIGEITIFADRWLGSQSPYSQIVEIEGVTENSQVDLTPSVEQLVIFYDKDLAFVTENEGGIVTVYVIGQKPKNDYTIQVTITEVNV